MQKDLLSQIDWWLTAVALKSEMVQHRYSWRLGRWIRSRTQAVHELVWGIGQRLGWSEVSLFFVKSARTQVPKEIPLYPSFFPLSKRISQRAVELLQGVCLLDEEQRLALEHLSWRRDPFEDESSLSRLLFHSLDWVRELLDAYYLSRSSDYLALAQELTSRWISECLHSEQTDNIWSDHGTGLRAVILCQLWVECRERESDDSPFLRSLLTALVRHAERLSHALFYRPEHNHGVTQAYALFAIGLLLPTHPNAGYWMRLGQRRLEQQMAENVSSEGVHREHSPYYHFYVFQHFWAALHLAQAYAIPFSQEFVDRLDLMLVAGAHCLKPDWSLPALGDTSRTSPLLVDLNTGQSWMAKFLPNSSSVWTKKGEKESSPRLTSVFYPEAGYAFFRSGSDSPCISNSECYLALRTATFPTSHIHYDVFSFELYGYGADLIIDSGGPFSYRHVVRKFFLSTSAHNTVVVDRNNQEVGQAEVLHWYSSSEYDGVVAQHRLYPGVVHRRAVVFSKPDYFLIVDHLESQQPHHYAQLFHLSPELEARQEELSIMTINPTGGPTVRILPLWQEDLILQLRRGETQPRQGWVCVGERQMIPNTVIEYQQTGTAATFVTLLLPEAPGVSTLLSGEYEGRPFSEETRFHIRIGDRSEDIILLPNGQVTLRKGSHDVLRG